MFRIPASCVALIAFLASGVSCGYGDVPTEVEPWGSVRNYKPLDFMVDITNKLGLDVLFEHNFLNDNNIAFSPYGLTGILVALYEGVDGYSALQIRDSMQLPADRRIVRIGFRDIHRRLRSYFIPEEGFLAGLTFNNENVTFRKDYRDILQFYGYDFEMPKPLPTQSDAGATVPHMSEAFSAPTSTTKIEAEDVEIITTTAKQQIETDSVSPATTESVTPFVTANSATGSTSTVALADPTTQSASASPTTESSSFANPTTESSSTLAQSASTTVSANKITDSTSESALANPTTESYSTSAYENRTTESTATLAYADPTTKSTSTLANTNPTAESTPSVASTNPTTESSTLAYTDPTTKLPSSQASTNSTTKAISSLASTNPTTESTSLLASNNPTTESTSTLAYTDPTTKSISTLESTDSTTKSTSTLASRNPTTESTSTLAYADPITKSSSTLASTDSTTKSTLASTNPTTESTSTLAFSNPTTESSSTSAFVDPTTESTSSAVSSTTTESFANPTTKSPSDVTITNATTQTTTNVVETTTQSEISTLLITNPPSLAITTLSGESENEIFILESTTEEALTTESKFTQNPKDQSTTNEEIKNTNSESITNTRVSRSTEDATSKSMMLGVEETLTSQFDTSTISNTATAENNFEEVSIATTRLESVGTTISGNSDDTLSNGLQSTESTTNTRTPEQITNAELMNNTEEIYFSTTLQATTDNPSSILITAATSSDDSTTESQIGEIQTTIEDTSDTEMTSTVSDISVTTNTEKQKRSTRKERSLHKFQVFQPILHDQFAFYRPLFLRNPNYARSGLQYQRSFLANGYSKVQITYMTYDTILEFAYIPYLKSMAVKLPLDTPDYYLMIILPDYEFGVNQLINDLRTQEAPSLRDINFLLSNTHVRAWVPSFMLKGLIVLTTDLQKLGICDVFEPRQDDFKPMTEQRNIYVRNIEQAITVTIRKYMEPNLVKRYVYNRPPVEFAATHPFVYFVMDSSLHVALMAGKIVNPLNSRIL